MSLSLVFFLLALLSLRQVGSLDAGFHLKSGEYILAGHSPPRTDPFTFTMKDHEWVNTSWGYDVVLAAVQKGLGAPGLVLLHALFVLATFLLLYLTARIGPADPTMLVLTLLAGGLASEMRFEVRPELWSYALLALVLYLLHRHAEGLRSPLWALPVIFLVWANSHSLFVVGWAALGCFAIGLTLRRLSLDRRLLLWSAASVGVALINPYGWRGFVFPFTLVTRLQQQNVFKQAIGEFVSPFDLGLSQRFPFYPHLPIFAFRLLLVLSVPAAAVLLFKQRRIWCVLLWLVSLGLAYKMIRNLPIFVIASLPGIVWGLPAERIMKGLGLGEGARRKGLRAALGISTAASIVLGARVVHDAHYIASRRVERFGWEWNRLALPLDAVSYADRAGLHGAVLNHLNFGGYLMWARPDPVFIDGRLEVVGEKFFDAYQSALASPSGLEACAARYGIRWLVFPYAAFPELLGRVTKDPHWRLAHVDSLAAVFIRSGPQADAWIDPGSPPAEAVGFRSLPGLDGKTQPTALTRWLRGIVHGEVFPSEEFNLGLFHLYRGDLDRAEHFFSRAIQRSGGAYYEIYSDLGAVLFREKKLDEAGECYRLVLERKPGDSLARERISAIENARFGSSAADSPRAVPLRTPSRR